MTFLEAFDVMMCVGKRQHPLVLKLSHSMQVEGQKRVGTTKGSNDAAGNNALVCYVYRRQGNFRQDALRTTTTSFFDPVPKLYTLLPHALYNDAREITSSRCATTN